MLVEKEDFMRDFYFWPFYGFLSKDLYWVRVRGIGYGLSLKRTPPLFSERNGYVKTLPLPFGWRVAILKARR